MWPMNVHENTRGGAHAELSLGSTIVSFRNMTSTRRRRFARFTRYSGFTPCKSGSRVSRGLYWTGRVQVGYGYWMWDTAPAPDWGRRETRSSSHRALRDAGRASNRLELCWENTAQNSRGLTRNLLIYCTIQQIWNKYSKTDDKLQINLLVLHEAKERKKARW